MWLPFGRRDAAALAVVAACVVVAFWKIALTSQYTFIEAPDIGHQVLPWLAGAVRRAPQGPRARFFGTPTSAAVNPLPASCSPPSSVPLPGSCWPLRRMRPDTCASNGSIGGLCCCTSWPAGLPMPSCVRSTQAVQAAPAARSSSQRQVSCGTDQLAPDRSGSDLASAHLPVLPAQSARSIVRFATPSSPADFWPSLLARRTSRRAGLCRASPLWPWAVPLPASARTPLEGGRPPHRHRVRGRRMRRSGSASAGRGIRTLLAALGELRQSDGLAVHRAVSRTPEPRLESRGTRSS